MKISKSASHFIFSGAMAFGFFSQSVWAVEVTMPYYKLTPVAAQQVEITDRLWTSRRDAAFGPGFDWVSAQFDKKGGGYRAFRESGRRDTIQVTPDVSFEAIKMLEGAGEYLKTVKDPVLEEYMDRCIDHWCTFQDKSGYFRGICRGDELEKGRWNDIAWGHELYGVGHLLEAAHAYKEATGKTKMYDAAMRAVAEVQTMFGHGKRCVAPGHAQIERALTRVYEAEGDTALLGLAKFFIDQRGRYDTRHPHPLGAYAQDHIPFTDQRRAEGHAVRGTYLYIGATDVVGATGNKDYETALDSIWHNLTSCHMYNTGAAGVCHSGIEGYAEDCNIAPDDVYGESCGAIANSVWAHKLNRLKADGAYMDRFEQIVYNAYLSSMNADGNGIYYCNHINRHSPECRYWPKCPCCPGNILTHAARIPGYIYATAPGALYVNLYIASDATIDTGNVNVKISQQTAYPADGNVILKIDSDPEGPLAINLRIPGWAKKHTLKVNGKTVDAKVDNGYATLSRQWKKGDRIELSLPMEPQREYMPAGFNGYEGRVALRRGPIVYTFEGIDNCGSVCNICLPKGAQLKCVPTDFASGLPKIEAQATVIDWDGKRKSRKATAIPYGFNSNRGTTVQYVWVAEKPEVAAHPQLHMNATHVEPAQ